MNLKKFSKVWSYQNIFLATVAIAGFFIMIVTPPFESPDEPNHFFRTYQIAHGGFFAERKLGASGGNLPQSLEYLVNMMIAAPVGKIPFRPEQKFSIIKIIDGTSYLSSAPQRFVSFPNTASYPFIAYIPQVIGVGVVGLFSQSVLLFFYSARLFSLVYFLVVGYLLLSRVARQYQEIFFISLVLPTVVSLAGVITADTVSTLAAYSATAFFLTEKSLGKSINRKNLLVYGLIALLLGLVKPVYALVILLVFCVPWSVQYSKLKNILIRVGLTAISFLGVGATLLIGKGTATVLRTDIVTNSTMQFDYLLHHPFAFLVTSVKYLFVNSEECVKQMIGIFGWNDTRLTWIGYLLGLGLLLIVIINKSEELETPFSWRDLFVVATIILGVVFGILVFLFLTWSPAGQGTIDGLQGRYFLPILPLLLIIARKLIWVRYSVNKAVPSIGAGLLLLLALGAIVSRFYL